MNWRVVLTCALTCGLVAVVTGKKIKNPYRERPSGRCGDVNVKRRVQCGFPGITKKKCLQDCNCCFDANAENDDLQCFYKVAPAKQGCCNIATKKRKACKVNGHHDVDLDEEPYLCRRLGCCYDGGHGGHRGHGGYGQHEESAPRCFRSRSDCCNKVEEDDRVDAALTDVNRQQCSRIPGTCFCRDDEPACYYKFAPCRCDVSSDHVRPCRAHDHEELNKDPFKCLQAGCCFNYKHKCYKPTKRTRSTAELIDLMEQVEEEETVDESDDIGYGDGVGDAIGIKQSPDVVPVEDGNLLAPQPVDEVVAPPPEQ